MSIIKKIKGRHSTSNLLFLTLRQIVRRRRNHEYKLLRRPARKEDFLAAVQYEMHLEQLRQHRKKVRFIINTVSGIKSTQL